MSALTPERIAEQFHAAYERLAPNFGYTTRTETAVPWADVPERNRQLMIAVCAEIGPLIEAAILRRVADECDAIRSGAAIGEFLPTTETWMRRRADQIEQGAADVH